MKPFRQATTPKKAYQILLRSFLLAATLVACIGILVAKTPGFSEEAQYLTILSASLACQGVWGFVLFDCMHRRLGKN